MMKVTAPSVFSQKHPKNAVNNARRNRGLFLRISNHELGLLDELVALYSLSRSAVVRMMIKHTHDADLGVAVRKQAEDEVSAEVIRRATEARVAELTAEVLNSVRAAPKPKKSTNHRKAGPL